MGAPERVPGLCLEFNRQGFPVLEVCAVERAYQAGQYFRVDADEGEVPGYYQLGINFFIHPLPAAIALSRAIEAAVDGKRMELQGLLLQQAEAEATVRALRDEPEHESAVDEW